MHVTTRPGPIRWVAPTCTAIHILINPVYAGAHIYGKTKYQRYVDEYGTVGKRFRHLGTRARSDGGWRLLGLPALEDKVVQGAMAEFLSAVCEVDFLLGAAKCYPMVDGRKA